MKKRMNNKKILLNGIVFIILTCCINVTYSIFNLKYYEMIPLSIDLFVIIFGMILHGRIKIKRIYFPMIYEFFFPLMIPSIIAAISAQYIYHDIKYTMSSFRIILCIFGAYLLGYFLVERFRLKAIYMFLTAGTISYITVIFRVLFTNAPDISLEVHELTYLYGVILVFFLTYRDVLKKDRIIACVVCVIGILLGDKRALWLGLLIALVVYFIFYRLLNNRERGLKFVAFCCIVGAFFWVWFIKSGYFDLLCIRFGIQDNTRIVMWNYFRNDYEISPFYWGRALTYTDVIMADVHDQLHISTAIPIHNAILKMYIGWGFLPFAYYIYYYIYKRILNIQKKVKDNGAWVFLAVSIVFYIVNFFGDSMFNMGTGILYGMIWSLLQQNIIYKSEKVIGGA